ASSASVRIALSIARYARQVRSLSKGWLVTGTLAVLGAYWVVVSALITADVYFEGMAYVGHGVGAALAGAILVTHAPVRLWREPLSAGVLAILLLVVMFLALPHARFSWIAKRTEHSWLVATAIALLSGASATAGAALVRKLAPAASATSASVLVLGGFV